MKREILNPAGCAAIVAKYSLSIGRRSLATRDEEGEAAPSAACFFNASHGECGVVGATAEANGSEGAMEGVRLLFDASEAETAHAALHVEISGLVTKLTESEPIYPSDETGRLEASPSNLLT